MKTLQLHDDRKLPIFGLGTWKSEPGEVYRAVRTAIAAGYTHLDCAAVYGNETDVGRAVEDAIAAGDTTRDALWITSKLWNDSHLPEQVPGALDQTLSDLRLDAVDLYLMHWPVALKTGASFPFEAGDFLTLDEAPLAATWEAMAKLREAGKALSIGVSNMGPQRIAHLSEEVGVTPSVDQVECHPFLAQTELRSFCHERGIALTAYSPLGSGDRNPAMKRDDEPPLLEHPTITAIAERHDATPGQVLIAWQVQRGVSVIPKSTHEGRIRENLAALDVTLHDDDMAAIAKMDRGYRFIDGSFWCKEGTPYDLETLFA